MSILVGKKALNFTAPAVLADGTIVEDFHLSTYQQDKILVLFFYPLDFSYVCPSEILAHHKRVDAFAQRNAKIVGVSIDSHFTHSAWRNATLQNGGVGKIDFPLVADFNHKIKNMYGISHPAIGVALRASFLIDSDFIVRHQTINDLPLGRSVDEMLRMVDALNFYNEHGEVCPAGWEQGKSAIEASPQGIVDYLSQHVDEL